MDRRKPLQIERISRLREIQRDQVGADVQKARLAEAQASEKVLQAQEAIREETVRIRQSVRELTPICSEDLALSSDCVRFEIETEKTLEERRKVAQQQYENHLEQLAVVHRQVQQMDYLADQLRVRIARDQRRAEQRELDELAVVKETSK